MDILFDGNRRRLAHRPPDAYVRRFGGYLQPNLECRDAVLFDRHSPTDEFLGVGTDEGRFYFGRVPQFLNGADGRVDENVGEPALVEPDGRRHAIFDFAFLPDRKVLLASLGGFVYLLDANTRQLTTVLQTAANTYFCASSEDLNLFVLGTRDSLVFRCYDVREPQQTRLVSTYDETKMATPGRKILTPTRKKPTPTTPTRKKATPMTPPVQEVKLTTIRHIRDRFFATTTTSHEKGIRVWDMRYAKGHTPVHTWEIPACGRSNFGCYGMQLDRGGVKLLAGCTDGKLREYLVHSGSTLPSRVFGGGSVGSFQHNVVYSPFPSLFVGPMKQGIGIWDSFQSPETPQSPAPSSQSTPSRRAQRFTPPRFGFKSCDEQTLSNCDWSPSGRYLAITTQQAFMICDGESEWARRAANAELSDFTNVDEFGVPLDFAFPMSSNRPRLPSPPDSRVGVINEEELAAYRTNKRARIDAELNASAAASAAAARSRPPSAPSAPRAGSSRQVAVVTIDDDDFDTNGVLRRTQSRMDDFLKGATNKSKLRTDFKTASGHRIVRHSEEPSGREAPFAPPRNEDGSENRPTAARVNDVLRAVSTNRRDENDRFSRVPRKKAYEPLRLQRNVGANRAYRDPMRSAAEEPAVKEEESEEAPLDETDLLIKNDPVLKAMDKNIIDMIKSEIIVLDLSLSWSDVVGLEGAKSALREIIVLPSIRPDLFRHLRKPSKAVLLFGPPGTGKTMIGRCVANQCKATFFNISASALTSKWVGEGEKLVRALFRIARLKEPSVIFIDEVDSLLSTRRESEHESSRRIKTEFLVQMDGIASNSGERLFVLAATNKPMELDEAARRRFEKRLYIALPTAEARKSMLDTNLGGLIHDLTPDRLEVLADRTEGYSGADMRQLCAEAAMGPIREIEDMSTMDIETVKEEEIRPISMRDFDDALQSVRPTVLQSELDAYRAYDEAFGYRKTRPAAPAAVAQEPLGAARKEAAQMS
ncbi:AAA domain-containing protein [Aphelenchoides fujianensis]|nr:AAA domain-containing protein [Aphelenchoides fujianensis]